MSLETNIICTFITTLKLQLLLENYGYIRRIRY